MDNVNVQPAVPLRGSDGDGTTISHPDVSGFRDAETQGCDRARDRAKELEDKGPESMLEILVGEVFTAYACLFKVVVDAV